MHVVLFVEGQKAADARSTCSGRSHALSAAAAAAAAALEVLHAELEIYYEIAVVVVYELKIPVGGSLGHGTEAMLRYWI